MFTTEASDVVSDDDEIDTPRPKRKARPRQPRDPAKLDRYYDRKGRQVCTGCEAKLPDGWDRGQCRPCLDKAKKSNAKYMTRLRKERRAHGLCASGCGRESKTYRCFVCAVRAGETPGYSPAESFSGVDSARDLTPTTAIHRETVTRDVTDATGSTRTRFHGSGKRGGANQTAFVVDGQNLRYAKAALEKAIAGCVEAESPDVKQLPRIQRQARRREWQALADLARRHLDELLEDYDQDDT